jgi:bifunctional DNA-binding transcriptional regulator/antitoxin component of YhaV-PrlF toxin-antitoxin module
VTFQFRDGVTAALGCYRAQPELSCLTYFLPNSEVEDIPMETTKLSSKGQVILPVSIRVANQWQAGVEFAVENTAEGVLLRPIKPGTTTTTLDEVIGCAGYTGKAHSVKEMDAAITAEIKSRHARD